MTVFSKRFLVMLLSIVEIRVVVFNTENCYLNNSTKRALCRLYRVGET